jgi:uncharacterized membrane protein (DUF373 family)
MASGAERDDEMGLGDSNAERAVGRIVDGSEFIMETLELLTGVVLIVLFAIGLYDLVRQIWIERGALFSDINAVLGFIDTVLLLLVIVEVFRTVVAFAREESVVRIIIDASLVAIARKIIGFDSSGSSMQVLLSAAAFSVLLLAVIAAYYVVRQVSVAVDETAEMPAAGSVELGGGETTRSDADTTTEQSERSGSSGSSS